MRHHLISIITLTTCCFTSSITQAETELDPVIVTASRHAETIDETMASVTVITRQDIENSSATDLGELLSSTTSIDIKPSGAYGKSTSLFMRGTSSSHILTLIDGVKFYSATSGSTAYQHIPLSQIERIEIVRGPRSSLYGSEAIGGVIQIFTRKGKKQNAGQIDIGMGSNNTTELSAGISGNDGIFSYSIHATEFDTTGIDSIAHTTANDEDAYNNKSISSHLGFAFKKVLSLDFQFMNAQGTTLYDNCLDAIWTPSDDCTADFVQQSFSSRLNITPNGIWDSSLQAGRSIDVNDNFWEGLPNNTYKTEHIDIAFINNFQFSDNHLFTLGFDYADDTVNATPYSNAEESRDNTSAFTKWSSNYKQLDFDLSLRRDDNEQFGKHSTGNFAAAYTLGDNSRIIASYGTAFKAPTFNDLYFPFYGSPTLVPEESDSFELGFRNSQDWGKWSITAFNTNIDNLIAYDSATFTANNISKAQIQGIELDISAELNQWNLSFSSSFIDPRNKDAADIDKILQARSRNSATINASKSSGNFSFATSLQAYGQRFTSSDNSTKVPGYGLLDLKFAYQLNKNTSVDMKIDNALDKEYVINQSSFATYNTLDRTIFASLHYKM